MAADNTSANAKKWLNAPENVVEEMVEGVIAAHAGQLVKLKGYNVLLHRNIDILKQGQVTILSGGGSGHEPAHAGYVGDGMISGAILGGVFASPSIDAVLAAIRAAAGPHGVLLVVKNYTGDRINFGQAALIAQTEGIKVATVIVADDCALPEGKGITGGRGVAGTVLVHKVAGAAARAGLPLEAVAAEATNAAETVKTLGVAMTTCTVPGTAPSDRLDSQTIEIGLGIHGEPGMKQSPLKPCDELVDEMVEVINSRAKLGAGDDVAVLVNNLGGTPTMELYLVARKATLAVAALTGSTPARVYVGSFMTALEMAGVSLSLLKLDPLLAARLDAATSAPAWPTTGGPVAPLAELEPVSAPADAADVSTGGAAGDAAVVDREAVRRVCQALIAAEPKLTEWDQIAGDGDCGITFQRGAEKILSSVDSYPVSSAEATLEAIATDVSASMGGTSGALLEIFFRAARVHLRAEGNAADYRGAFSAGANAIKDVGGADAGYRTMLDALLPAAAALVDGAPLEAAIAAAEEGAESTMKMEGLAGRSNYIRAELLATVPDPGAKAIAIAMRAFAGL